MKKLIAFLLSFFLALSLGLLAEASDTLEMNRKMGYFDNTRTVLLLSPRLSGNGGEAASYVNREMKQISAIPITGPWIPRAMREQCLRQTCPGWLMNRGQI